jgi:hypothetical protein
MQRGSQCLSDKSRRIASHVHFWKTDTSSRWRLPKYCALAMLKPRIPTTVN